MIPDAPEVYNNGSVWVDARSSFNTAPGPDRQAEKQEASL